MWRRWSTPPDFFLAFIDELEKQMILSMVPEIGSATDRIFCYSGLLFALLPLNGPRKPKFWKNEKIQKNQKKTPEDIIVSQMCTKWQPYDVWFLRYGVQKTEFFAILKCFLHFYPPSNLKNQNFEKMNITPGDIIILNMCSINGNHMMYGSWDIKYDRQFFFVILDHFFPFTPIKTQNIKILKKWKNSPGNIIILHKCTKNHDHILHCSWDMTEKKIEWICKKLWWN